MTQYYKYLSADAVVGYLYHGEGIAYCVPCGKSLPAVNEEHQVKTAITVAEVEVLCCAKCGGVEEFGAD